MVGNSQTWGWTGYRDQILENVMLKSLHFNPEVIEKPLKHFKQGTDMSGFTVVKGHYDSFMEDHLEGW